MSEEQKNNNEGAVNTQPGVFGNDGTGTPAPAGGAPTPPAPGAGDPTPPVPAGGSPAPSEPGTGNPTPSSPAGGTPAVLPELTEYATNLFEGVEPESLDYKLFERARVAAHKAGVPAEALSAVMGDVRTFINETEAQIQRERMEASNEQLKELQQTYGGKFKAVMEACDNTLCNLAAEFGVDTSVFNLPEIRNNPEIVKFFYGLHGRMKEAGFANVDKMSSLATAEQELESIYNGTHELSKAYMDSSHPDWKRAQDRVNELTEMTMGK